MVCKWRHLEQIWQHIFRQFRPSLTYKSLYAQCGYQEIVSCCNLIRFVCAFDSAVPPKWKEMPPDSTVRSGSNLLIKCQAAGVPQPKIKWKKMEENSEEQRFTDITYSKESNVR